MDKRTARKLLQEERERLEELLGAVSIDVRQDGEQQAVAGELSSEDQHPADLGTDTFERSRDASIAQNLEAQLRDVSRALKRIGEGTYGTCEACGRRIEKERLEARPASRYCVEDQERAEREAS